MAEAFGNMLGYGRFEVYSSGSRPSGKVNDKAVTAMQALGYELSLHHSKPLSAVPAITYDAVITMGCGDTCPQLSALRREDWSIPDPKNMGQDEFNQVRDLIKLKVAQLFDDIGSDVQSA